MADVLLTHSYFLAFDPKEFRAMMPYAPLGTLYAASHLRSRGVSAALFDAMLASGEEAVIPLIERHRPKIVAIYDDDFNYLTKMCLSRMRRAAIRMAGLAKERGCTVVVHGSDASDHAAEYLDGGADYVVIGEGEATLGELAGAILGSGRAPASIAGLAYLENGAIRRTGEREVKRALDDLPFPAWDLVDVEAYRSRWRERHGYYSMNIVTTRGCPFHCNWCAKPVYGQVYNSRSPENVVEEIGYLRRAFRPDHLWFCDDIFGLKPGWIQRFAGAVEAGGAAVPFKCLSRVDLLLKDDTIRALARAGCASTWVGAESGSQKILDAMDKGTTVEQIAAATDLLHRNKIKVGFFLQFGYPGETREDIDKTLEMVRRCAPDDIGISVTYPLPGTGLYERVRKQLGEKTNWTDSQDLDLMFPGRFIPDFYRVLHRVTHKRFRIWQAMSMLREGILKPRTLDRSRLRRIAAAGYHAVTLPRLTARLRSLERESPPRAHDPG